MLLCLFLDEPTLLWSVDGAEGEWADAGNVELDSEPSTTTGRLADRELSSDDREDILTGETETGRGREWVRAC